MTPKTSCLSAVFKTLCNSIILGGQEGISRDELIYPQIHWIKQHGLSTVLNYICSRIFHYIPILSILYTVISHKLLIFHHMSKQLFTQYSMSNTFHHAEQETIINVQSNILDITVVFKLHILHPIKLWWFQLFCPQNSMHDTACLVVDLPL